jgi:DNA-binding LacI/PurR family transcriptional regulator
VPARSSDKPFVLIGENVYDVPRDHIAIDNVVASHVAVQRLVSLGRHRIANRLICAFTGTGRRSPRRTCACRKTLP